MLLLLGVGMLGAVAGLAALSIVSVAREVGPGRVELRARITTDAHTQLGFPPLGRVSAGTHSFPLTVDARVDELDIEALQALLNGAEPEDELRQEVEADIEPLVRAYAWRALAFAAVAGLLVGLVVPGRRIAFVAAGMLGALVAVSGALASTWRDFEPRAFDEPEFEGALERAPEVIDAVQRHVDDLDAIRDRVEVLGLRMSRLYAVATATGEDTEADEVRILHVSDIHSNPLGVEIVADLADRFDVHAVLDTGDLTSFGYPIEAQLGEFIRRVPRPYLFVPGNHDSEPNRTALAAVRNVELLDGDVVDVRGVRILGVADPTFTASNEIDSDKAAAVKDADSARVARLVRRHDPDVLAVHDRRLAAAALGDVDLVVGGHYHERSERVERGTRVLTVGSTGATGLGSFTVTDDLAYEAQVLHFVDGELVSVDYLALDGLSGNYRIDRRIAEPPEPGEDPAEARR